MAERSGRVLVVDDDPAVGLVLRSLLSQAGYEAEHVLSPLVALQRVEREPLDVVITDLKMPELDGMEMLLRLREMAPGLPVVMLTAHGDVQTAVEAMRRGAADFLVKPFDRDDVLFTVSKALERAERAEARQADVSPPPATGEASLGLSHAMQEVSALITRAAQANSTVLIRGESGSGKEVAARAIHSRGPRASGPFVPVHCAAMPENLLESELFGYEKGAFTGAFHRKPGRVELAQGGTLFLDEIGDISPAVQVKLLRLLQEKEYQRLGGTVALKADVRFLAATHRDLEEMVKEGLFREDLYYRLNVIPVWIPPLRERRSDISELAVEFCTRLGTDNGRPGLTFDDDALDLLRAAPWPGNVRELSNVVERLVVFADGDVIGEGAVAAHLQPKAPVRVVERDAASLEERRGAAERDAIIEALDKSGGNRTQAARLLGISRRTLYNKLASFELMGDG